MEYFNLEELASSKKSSDKFNHSQISPALKTINFLRLSETINLPLETVRKNDKILIYSSEVAKNKNNEFQWVNGKKIQKELFPKNFTHDFINGNIFELTPMPSIFSILTRWPELLLRNLQENGNEYEIFLFVNGKWLKTIVNDYFPFCGDLYAFTSIDSIIGQGNYVMTLEKALASYFGSYEQLFKNKINRILKIIIGTPLEKLIIKENSEEFISSCFYRGFIIYFQGNKKEEFFCYHAFALLEIIQNKDGQRFYKLKGSNQKIAMKLQEMSPDQQKQENQNGQSGENLSSFLISFEKLANILPNVTIFKFHENYYHTWFELTNFQTVLSFSCQINQHLYISISFDQKIMKRCFLIKFLGDENNFEVLLAFYNNKKTNTFEEFLEPGEYRILVEFEIASKGIISIYSGNSSLTINNLKFTPQNFSLLEENIFKLIANNGINSTISPTQTIFNYGENYNEPRVNCFSDIIFGCLYIYYINQSKKKLIEKIEVKKPKNFMLSSKTASNINLNPNADFLIIYKEDMKGLVESPHQYEIARETKFEDLELPFIDNNVILAFNSNVHNDNPFLLKEPEKESELNGKAKLIKVMKDIGRKSKRIYENKEIEVFCYTLLHDAGVVILYTNYTYFPYEENVIWELENLKLINQNEENVVRFQMEPYSEYFIFLDRIDINKPYSFKTKCYYKYYPEK